MKSLLEDDDDARRRNERELTLNTGTILGIFIALVLLCGAFFGFGYKLGSHKTVPPGLGAVADTAPEPSANFTDFKPAAGSPESDDDPASASARRTAVERKEERAAEAAEKPAVPAPGPQTAAGRAEPSARAVVEPPVAPGPVAAATGTYFVQVAAVSHEEDAQLLIHALKAKGYPVGAHLQPQDKFYHVQVGPFDNRKDADAAKQRLLADGYQPIIK